jgi:hypothetical protein
MTVKQFHKYLEAIISIGQGDREVKVLFPDMGSGGNSEASLEGDYTLDDKKILFHTDQMV